MKDIGKHDNVIQIFGCCTKSRPVCLVLEYAPGGNLLNYLRALKRQVITGTKKLQLIPYLYIKFAGFDGVFVSQIIFITIYACTIELKTMKNNNVREKAGHEWLHIFPQR